jgi:hypothetical protein
MKIDIDDTLTITGVCEMFVWRTKRNLPYITFPGGDRTIVRFIKNDLLAWAEQEDQKVADVNVSPQRLVEFHNYNTEDDIYG